MKREGAHTVFVVCDGTTYETTDEHLEAMLRAEDISTNDLHGTTNHLPKEMYAEAQNRTVRWIKRVLD